MRATMVVLAVTLSALASYAGSGPQLSDSEKAKVESEVKASVQAFVAAANAIDADRAFAYFSSAPDFIEADNGRLFTSRDAFLAVYREAYSKLKSQDRRLADEHISVLSRDLAMYTAGGTFSLTYTSGTKTPPTPIAWTLLWRREGAQWKVINAHQSFVPPVAP